MSGVTNAAFLTLCVLPVLDYTIFIMCHAFIGLSIKLIFWHENALIVQQCMRFPLFTVKTKRESTLKIGTLLSLMCTFIARNINNCGCVRIISFLIK